MIKIRKALPVHLHMIWDFDIYSLALEHTLSFEDEEAEFLKSPEGLQIWLEREATFDTFKYSVNDTAWRMITITDETPIIYDEWKMHVSNNKSVINYLCQVLYDIHEPMELEEDLVTQFEAMDLKGQKGAWLYSVIKDESQPWWIKSVLAAKE